MDKERKQKYTKTIGKGPHIIFLRPGEKAGRDGGGIGILVTAKDWEMRVDLVRQLKFPEEIAITSLRPDIILILGTLHYRWPSKS